MPPLRWIINRFFDDTFYGWLLLWFHWTRIDKYLTQLTSPTFHCISRLLARVFAFSLPHALFCAACNPHIFHLDVPSDLSHPWLVQRLLNTTPSPMPLALPALPLVFSTAILPWLTENDKMPVVPTIFAASSVSAVPIASMPEFYPTALASIRSLPPEKGRGRELYMMMINIYYYINLNYKF